MPLWALSTSRHYVFSIKHTSLICFVVFFCVCEMCLHSYMCLRLCDAELLGIATVTAKANSKLHKHRKIEKNREQHNNEYKTSKKKEEIFIDFSYFTKFISWITIFVICSVCLYLLKIVKTNNSLCSAQFFLILLLCVFALFVCAVYV